MVQPRSNFSLYFVFSTTILQKNVDFSGIETRIVGVEGEQADHLTITTAHDPQYSVANLINNLRS